MNRAQVAVGAREWTLLCKWARARWGSFVETSRPISVARRQISISVRQARRPRAQLAGEQQEARARRTRARRARARRARARRARAARGVKCQREKLSEGAILSSRLGARFIAALRRRRESSPPPPSRARAFMIRRWHRRSRAVRNDEIRKNYARVRPRQRANNEPSRAQKHASARGAAHQNARARDHGHDAAGEAPSWTTPLRACHNLSTLARRTRNWVMTIAILRSERARAATFFARNTTPRF